MQDTLLLLLKPYSENSALFQRKFKLELGDFGDSYLIGRGKCARFCELQLKICEMKIQPVN